jgi:hypothetical protein
MSALEPVESMIAFRMMKLLAAARKVVPLLFPEGHITLRVARMLERSLSIF